MQKGIAPASFICLSLGIYFHICHFRCGLVNLICAALPEPRAWPKVGKSCRRCICVTCEILLLSTGKDSHEVVCLKLKRVYVYGPRLCTGLLPSSSIPRPRLTDLY